MGQACPGENPPAEDPATPTELGPSRVVVPEHTCGTTGPSYRRTLERKTSPCLPGGVPRRFTLTLFQGLPLFLPPTLLRYRPPFSRSDPRRSVPTRPRPSTTEEVSTFGETPHPLPSEPLDPPSFDTAPVPSETYTTHVLGLVARAKDYVSRTPSTVSTGTLGLSPEGRETRRDFTPKPLPQGFGDTETPPYPQCRTERRRTRSGLRFGGHQSQKSTRLGWRCRGVHQNTGRRKPTTDPDYSRSSETPGTDRMGLGGSGELRARFLYLLLSTVNNLVMSTVQECPG